ncbi:hypothetical protein INR49_017834 [Caranx melampygus]|nr:hypothetical protein INR49_017834 [Caranx melampygus]
MFLSRFDGQSKLLVRSLLSGASGALRALDVFHRQQRANPDMSLCNFIETLCQDDVTCPETDAQSLTVKPLVCLFPALFKQNLLSFIYLVHSVLPQTSVLHLLKCLSQDPHPTPWIIALGRQLRRSLGVHTEEPLCTPLCSQRLSELSQRLVGSGETGGWAQCLSSQTMRSESLSASGSSEEGTQRKRKGNLVPLDSEDDDKMTQQSKRTKLDVCRSECVHAEQQSTNEETSEKLGEGAPAETPADQPCDFLPEHIKVEALQEVQDLSVLLTLKSSNFRVSILQIKELLESQTEWDQNSIDLFKVLNSCDPGQLQHAATLIESLLLEKVLSLSEPASRCLVTAVTSLCSRYPRPMCHALVRPVLMEKHMGNPQAELLNRLIEGCLDSHYRLLLLQMTFKIAWTEALLSIIHSLLDSKPDLTEEVFSQFTEQLVNQGPQFVKSVKFAKMMLTVLTKYSSHVTATHKNSLSSCLMVNETFLKKSLQAALKRITNS